MIEFPISNLMDDQACYAFLRECLHPDGLHCPHGHPLPPGQAPHDRHRAPIMDYRCRVCGAVFNVFSGTLLAKSRYRCSTLVLLLRGIAQGVPTKHLATELGLDRSHLTARRHAIQALLEQRLPPSALDDAVTRGRRSLRQRGREGATPPRPRRSAAPPGPTNGVGMALGLPTDRRLGAWWDAVAVRYGCGCYAMPTASPCARWWRGRPCPAAPSTPTSGAATGGSIAPPIRIRRSTIHPVSGNGRAMTMAMASARSMLTPSKAYGPGA